MENGETTFHYNEYSWNLENHVLYIESPAGVGFSYCNNTMNDKDCAFDDDTSAKDNLDAIVFFFEKEFPEFIKNPLYISGESYAGIYVPYVAHLIDQKNLNLIEPCDEHDQETGNCTVLNLKGFMVGNGCTNWEVDCNPAYIEMAYWHGLYDDELYNDIHNNNCLA